MTGLICGNCTVLFHAPQSTSQAAKLAAVLQCSDECSSEQLRINEHSPGVVENEEEMVGCICHPNHTQNGKVHYKFSDAAFAHGMSVTRKVHRPDWKSSVEHLCRSRVCNREGKREYHALGSFQAGNVREVLYEDQTRAFYIYDTAAANNAAHADVFSFRYPGNSDALTEDARTDRMTAQMQLVLGVTES